MKETLNTPKMRALAYHRYPRPGKIEIVPTKSFSSPEDLALAYSPGVAFPCLEIADCEDKVYDYTNLGNTVAVISNGTAVLGLGNIGATASNNRLILPPAFIKNLQYSISCFYCIIHRIVPDM